MFRAVLQKNEKVLRGLICALLHLAPEDIASVEITNPIQLGKDIDAKECHLDIAVKLNNATHLNLEMQVRNEGNCPERSLSYLCRSFDSLIRGQDYLDIPAVMHFSFLDFTLFPDQPEFYANYQMLNVKSHRKYSDRFRLFVIDLTQIHLATEEDKAYQLDYWAEFNKKEAEFKKNEAELKKKEAEYKEKIARQESILEEKDLEIQRLKEALAEKQ